MFYKCPVTVEDVNIMEKIFGPDVATLKGKTTRHASTVARENLIDLPPKLKENVDLILCMDLMYMQGIPMLTTMDTRIKFRVLVPLKNRTPSEIYEGLDLVLRHYNKAGFQIKDIHCDQEFKSMMNKVSDDLDVKMNYTTTGEHVPEAERNNHTIKERM